MVEKEQKPSPSHEWHKENQQSEVMFENVFDYLCSFVLVVANISVSLSFLSLSPQKSNFMTVITLSNCLSNMLWSS